MHAAYVARPAEVRTAGNRHTLADRRTRSE